MEFVNWLVLVPALFVFVFGVLRRLNGWYYAAKLRKIWDELPPGDMGWPLLGTTISFINEVKLGRPENFFHSLRHGEVDMYKTHVLGSPTIVVCTPELCRKVLIDEDRFAPWYPGNIKDLFGRRSLMQVYRAEHRRLRRLTTAPISSPAALEMYINHIQDSVVCGLEEWASMQRPIELLSELKKLTFKIVWNIFMGSTSLDDFSIGELEDLFKQFARGILALPINFPGFNLHKSFKARKKWLKILESIVHKKRLAKKIKGESWEPKDMMDLMIEVKDEDGAELDDETIIDLIFGKLYAGHETSAVTAMWAVLFLTDHPHIFQKAKEEQEDIIKRRPSTQKGVNHSDFKQMKFLSQVIDETLRHGNIVFMLFRSATNDIEINGKIIPKGWKVIPWLGKQYMDEKLFSSPHEFNPSRWDNFIATPGAFAPFGIGSRKCPGTDLAKLEISIFLHYFLLNYKVERVNPKCELTCVPFRHPKDKCLGRVLKVV